MEFSTSRLSSRINCKTSAVGLDESDDDEDDGAADPATPALVPPSTTSIPPSRTGNDVATTGAVFAGDVSDSQFSPRACDGGADRRLAVDGTKRQDLMLAIIHTFY